MSAILTPTPQTASQSGPVLATAAIRVHYVRDADDGLWHFCVGNPAILGGACRSREEAERRAAEAIARALSTGHPHRCGGEEEGGEMGGFEVDIRLGDR